MLIVSQERGIRIT
jgi:hypothetical protein